MKFDPWSVWNIFGSQKNFAKDVVMALVSLNTWKWTHTINKDAFKWFAYCRSRAKRSRRHHHSLGKYGKFCSTGQHLFLTPDKRNVGARGCMSNLSQDVKTASTVPETRKEHISKQLWFQSPAGRSGVSGRSPLCFFFFCLTSVWLIQPGASLD